MAKDNLEQLGAISDLATTKHKCPSVLGLSLLSTQVALKLGCLNQLFATMQLSCPKLGLILQSSAPEATTAAPAASSKNNASLTDAAVAMVVLGFIERVFYDRDSVQYYALAALMADDLSSAGITVSLANNEFMSALLERSGLKVLASSAGMLVTTIACTQEQYEQLNNNTDLASPSSASPILLLNLSYQAHAPCLSLISVHSLEAAQRLSNLLEPSTHGATKVATHDVSQIATPDATNVHTTVKDNGPAYPSAEIAVHQSMLALDEHLDIVLLLLLRSLSGSARVTWSLADRRLMAPIELYCEVAFKLEQRLAGLLLGDDVRLFTTLGWYLSSVPQSSWDGLLTKLNDSLAKLSLNMPLAAIAQRAHNNLSNLKGLSLGIDPHSHRLIATDLTSCPQASAPTSSQSSAHSQAPDLAHDQAQCHSSSQSNGHGLGCGHGHSLSQGQAMCHGAMCPTLDSGADDAIWLANLNQFVGLSRQLPEQLAAFDKQLLMSCHLATHEILQAQQYQALLKTALLGADRPQSQSSELGSSVPLSNMAAAADYEDSCALTTGFNELYELVIKAQSAPESALNLEEQIKSYLSLCAYQHMSRLQQQIAALNSRYLALATLTNHTLWSAPTLLSQATLKTYPEATTAHQAAPVAPAEPAAPTAPTAPASPAATAGSASPAATTDLVEPLAAPVELSTATAAPLAATIEPHTAHPTSQESRLSAKPTSLPLDLADYPVDLSLLVALEQLQCTIGLSFSPNLTLNSDALSILRAPAHEPSNHDTNSSTTCVNTPSELAAALIMLLLHSGYNISFMGSHHLAYLLLAAYAQPQAQPQPLQQSLSQPQPQTQPQPLQQSLSQPQPQAQQPLSQPSWLSLLANDSEWLSASYWAGKAGFNLARHDGFELGIGLGTCYGLGLGTGMPDNSVSASSTHPSQAVNLGTCNTVRTNDLPSGVEELLARAPWMSFAQAFGFASESSQPARVLGRATLSASTVSIASIPEQFAKQDSSADQLYFELYQLAKLNGGSAQQGTIDQEWPLNSNITNVLLTLILGNMAHGEFHHCYLSLLSPVLAPLFSRLPDQILAYTPSRLAVSTASHGANHCTSPSARPSPSKGIDIGIGSDQVNYKSQSNGLRLDAARFADECATQQTGGPLSVELNEHMLEYAQCLLGGLLKTKVHELLEQNKHSKQGDSSNHHSLEITSMAVLLSLLELAHSQLANFHDNASSKSSGEALASATVLDELNKLLATDSVSYQSMVVDLLAHARCDVMAFYGLFKAYTLLANHKRHCSIAQLLQEALKQLLLEHESINVQPSPVPALLLVVQLSKQHWLPSLHRYSQRPQSSKELDISPGHGHDLRHDLGLGFNWDIDNGCDREFSQGFDADVADSSCHELSLKLAIRSGSSAVAHLSTTTSAKLPSSPDSPATPACPAHTASDELDAKMMLSPTIVTAGFTGGSGWTKKVDDSASLARLRKAEQASALLCLSAVLNGIECTKEQALEVAQYYQDLFWLNLAQPLETWFTLKDYQDQPSTVSLLIKLCFEHYLHPHLYFKDNQVQLSKLYWPYLESAQEHHDRSLSTHIAPTAQNTQTAQDTPAPAPQNPQLSTAATATATATATKAADTTTSTNADGTTGAPNTDGMAGEAGKDDALGAALMVGTAEAASKAQMPYVPRGVNLAHEDGGEQQDLSANKMSYAQVQGALDQEWAEQVLKSYHDYQVQLQRAIVAFCGQQQATCLEVFKDYPVEHRRKLLLKLAAEPTNAALVAMLYKGMPHLAALFALSKDSWADFWQALIADNDYHKLSCYHVDNLLSELSAISLAQAPDLHGPLGAIISGFNHHMRLNMVAWALEGMAKLISSADLPNHAPSQEPVQAPAPAPVPAPVAAATKPEAATPATSTVAAASPAATPAVTPADTTATAKAAYEAENNGKHDEYSWQFKSQPSSKQCEPQEQHGLGKLDFGRGVDGKAWVSDEHKGMGDLLGLFDSDLAQQLIEEQEDQCEQPQLSYNQAMYRTMGYTVSFKGNEAKRAALNLQKLIKATAAQLSLTSLVKFYLLLTNSKPLELALILSSRISESTFKSSTSYHSVTISKQQDNLGPDNDTLEKLDPELLLSLVKALLRPNDAAHQVALIPVAQATKAHYQSSLLGPTLVALSSLRMLSLGTMLMALSTPELQALSQALTMLASSHAHAMAQPQPQHQPQALAPSLAPAQDLALAQAQAQAQLGTKELASWCLLLNKLKNNSKLTSQQQLILAKLHSELTLTLWQRPDFSDYLASLLP